MRVLIHDFCSHNTIWYMICFLVEKQAQVIAKQL